MSSVGVGGLGPEGGDLVVDAADHRHHDAEIAPHSDGLWEEPLHRVGRSVGRDVDVGDRFVQKEVPYGAAGEIHLVALSVQNLADVESALQQACLDSFQHSPPLRFEFGMEGSGLRVRFGSWPGPDLL